MHRADKYGLIITILLSLIFLSLILFTPHKATLNEGYIIMGEIAFFVLTIIAIGVFILSKIVNIIRKDDKPFFYMPDIRPSTMIIRFKQRWKDIVFAPLIAIILLALLMFVTGNLKGIDLSDSNTLIILALFAAVVYIPWTAMYLISSDEALERILNAPN
jgi:hypothetical protein